MRAKSSVRHWHTIPGDCGKKCLVELLGERWTCRPGKRRAASFVAVSIQRKLGYHQEGSLNVLHVVIHLALRVLKNAQCHYYSITLEVMDRVVPVSRVHQ